MRQYKIVAYFILTMIMAVCTGVLIFNGDKNDIDWVGVGIIMGVSCLAHFVAFVFAMLEGEKDSVT